MTLSNCLNLKAKTETQLQRDHPFRTHPAVDDRHMKRVSVEPALHGFTDGADLIQRWGVHVRPARVQRLKAPPQSPWLHTHDDKYAVLILLSLIANLPWGSFWRDRVSSRTG